MRYIFIAMLLIPAWVGAGDSPNCTSDNMGACRIPVNPDPIIYLSEIDEMIPASCVQRMREAMKAMDKMVPSTATRDKIRAGTWDGPPTHKGQVDVFEHWDQTMKDCVEG